MPLTDFDELVEYINEDEPEVALKILTSQLVASGLALAATAGRLRPDLSRRDLRDQPVWGYRDHLATSPNFSRCHVCQDLRWLIRSDRAESLFA